MKEQGSKDQSEHLALVEARTKIAKLDNTKHSLERKVAELTEAKRNALEMSEHRLATMDRLHGELQNSEKKLLESSQREASFQDELNEAKRALAPTKMERDRFQQELEALREHVKWAEEEQAKTSKELLEERKANAAEIAELNAQLHSKTIELTNKVEILRSEEIRTKEIGERLNKAQASLRDLQTSSAVQEEHYRTELEQSKKLCELYKISQADAEEKAKESAALLESLRVAATKAQNSYQEKEKKWNEEKKRLALVGGNQSALSSASSTTATSLPNQDVLASMGSLAPSAVAAMQEKQGMTMTEMYSAKIAVEQENAKLKEQKRKLETYMAEILNEVQSKAPLINEQQQEYQRLVASHDEVSGRLEKAMQENRTINIQLRRAEEERDLAQKRVAAMDQENTDLGRQIQNLLRKSLAGTLSATKNALFNASSPYKETNTMPSSYQTPMQHSGSTKITAHRAITENLVTFSDIEDLNRKIRN